VTDVDVVIPVRDGGRLLQRAVDSVLEQGGVRVRVFVVDDGSRDGAPDRLRRDPRLHVLRAIGRGIPAALEQGIQAGTATLVARQDADDVSLPGRLAAQVEHLDRHEGIGLVATGFEVLVGRRVVARLSPSPAGLLDKNPFCAGSMMVRREVHVAAGGYREAFSVSSDYDMWLRCAEVCGVSVLPVAGYQYRLTSGMTTIRRAARQAAYADLARASARARRQGRPDPAGDPATASAHVERVLASAGSDGELSAWWAQEFAALGDRREALRCLRASGLPPLRMLALLGKVVVPPSPQVVWQ
jgi:glycosyltransferase involved in cell wall biosynthesis